MASPNSSQEKLSADQMASSCESEGKEMPPKVNGVTSPVESRTGTKPKNPSSGSSSGDMEKGFYQVRLKIAKPNTERQHGPKLEVASRVMVRQPLINITMYMLSWLCCCWVISHSLRSSKIELHDTEILMGVITLKV